MKASEIKEELFNCKCEGCSLRKACDLYEELTGETICSVAEDNLEGYENEA